MTASRLVEPLRWDSDFWGVSAARIHVEDAHQLDSAAIACRANGVQWASLLVPAERFDLLNAAVRSGYDIVDVRYTLEAPVQDPAAAVEVQLADASDAAALADIARQAFVTSRFFQDPRLPDRRCQDFYETWLRNSLSGELADAVVVARSEGRAAGFMTVRREAEDGSVIPLVAVAPTHHRRGLGRQLLEATMSWASREGCSSIRVVTQLTNTSAIALYNACGFRLVDAGVWLHRWFDTVKASEPVPQR